MLRCSHRLSPGGPKTVTAGPATECTGVIGRIAAGIAPILPAASCRTLLRPSPAGACHGALGEGREGGGASLVDIATGATSDHAGDAPRPGGRRQQPTPTAHAHPAAVGHHDHVATPG